MDPIAKDVVAGAPTVPATPAKNPGIYNGEILHWKGYSWQVANTGSMEDGAFVVLLVQKNETARHRKIREKEDDRKNKILRGIRATSFKQSA